jgi:hydroxymethylpyrimidine/phosphomethylpyrimidine kinase
MPTYSIYLNAKEADELKRTASKHNLSPLYILKKRLKRGMAREEKDRVNLKLNAIIQLLEMMIPELAYTAGANRAASAGIASAVNKGNSLEDSHKKAAELIRARLERFVGAVVL